MTADAAATALRAAEAFLATLDETANPLVVCAARQAVESLEVAYRELATDETFGCVGDVP